MTNPTIAVLIGSLSKQSINRRLAEAMMRLGEQRFVFREAQICDLPHYDRDLDTELPASVLRLKSLIDAADGVLLVGPEYNRSYAAVLKNAIDWASRPYGRSSWSGKPSAIAGISSGSLGTAPAQQHLRNILSHLDSPVLTTPEVYMAMRDGLFDEEGNIADATARQFLDGFHQRFATHVERYRSERIVEHHAGVALRA